MKLGAANPKAGKAPAKQALPGRSLWLYLAPAPVVAVLVLLLLAFVAQQWVQSGERETARRGMHRAAGVLAGQVAGNLENARHLLRLIAADPRVEAALGGDDAMRAGLAEQLLRDAVPQWLQLRLLPADWNRPEVDGPAPMGYAGVDMVRRAVGGTPPPAEVHQLTGGVPYVALAEAVKVKGATLGVLFAALPLTAVTAVIDAQTGLPGRAWLTQRVDGGKVALGVASAADAQADDAVAVPGSILEVAYRARPELASVALLLPFLGMVIGGAAALGLVGYLQWRHLVKDLRTDLGSAVAFGEAILNGQGGGPVAPQLRATADALVLLAQYAQSARGSPRGKAGAAVPQGAGVSSFASNTAQQEVMVEELDPNDASLAEMAAGPRPLLPPQVFRAYDIRGLAGAELSPEGVALLGRALGTLVQEGGGHNLAVGRDARLSSPKLAAALIEGIASSGLDVIDLGAVPTPLAYFSRFAVPTDGVVMVTGSHNPAAYNGFKIQLGDDMLAEGDLAALRERTVRGQLASGKGARMPRDLGDDYVNRILGDVALARDLRIVVDAGNGIAGPLAVQLFEALGCEVSPLYCEPDGAFPHHHPDPGVPENLADLIATVQATGADLGIAFDGDGDRVVFIDSAGDPVWPDQLLMLLAADVLVRHPGADILYDVKSSRHLAGFVLASGGRPIMWQSGHARIKAKLRDTGALLAGEFAGHYYIKERWYGFDDGLYTAARVLEILSADARPTAEIFAELPSSPATPEYQLVLPEGRSVELMRAIAAKAEFADAKIVDIDGLRVEFAAGWGLVRASNTTPALTFRFEAEDEDALARVQERFRRLLAAVDPALSPPF